MPLIKPRTHGKQMVRRIVRLDRETNETLFAYAHFLSTIHANSAEQALTRLAHCVLTANVGLPHRSTREAIALAIHLVVHIGRIRGHRRVTQVAAVRGYDVQSDRFLLESRLLEHPVPQGALS
jgi:hypothetical protein